MSQRRGGSKASMKPAVEVSNEEMVPFSECLDAATSSSLQIDRESMEPLQQLQLQQPVIAAPTSGSTSSTVPAGNSTLDSRFDAEQQRLKVQSWKESHFATGLVPATWEEEYHSYRNDMKGQCMKMVDNDNTTPCGCCSAMICFMLGAGRVGNMAVLRQSTEWVDELVEAENGETTTMRVMRPRLDVVVGPYWPMLMFVTYPLILGVSGLTLITVIPNKHPLLGLGWGILTVGLISALALTACRDPGILPRYNNPPPDDNGWRWNERSHSYRPRSAWYDPDTAVVVEEFDHTCPWTGTAIGKKNMLPFQTFVCLVFVCLIMNIILLTGGI
ncbi:DHHC palmitoyltransferase [Nitzschia inconspicua]|uniref:Palmitoyltransferase n=1 Tax=Nitzschia inconspicua TaxID=303405 RepID=A0A9K3L6C9_9STRA|nr:DHHC palmitoyltransferase [Nitzschia inconspicua]